MILRLAAALILLAAGATGAAEPVTVVVGPGGAAEAAKLVDALRRDGVTVVVRVGDAAGGARTSAADGPTDTAGSSDGSLAALFSSGLRRELEAVPAISRLAADASAAWSSNRNPGAPILLVWLVALLAGFAVLRALRARTPAAAGDGLAPRLAAAAAVLTHDLAAIAALALAGWIAADLLLPEPDFARAVATTALWAVAGILAYAAAGRFLLSPGDPARRLLPIERPSRHRALMLGYGAADLALNASVDLGQAAGAGAIHGWFLVADTMLTAYVVWWFWDMRHDAALLVRRGGADPSAPTAMRRAAAVATPWILMAIALLMWAAGRVAAVASDGVRWGFAAQITQVLVVAVPIAAAGAAALLHSLFAPAAGTDSPQARALAAIATTAGAGAAWIAGILLLAKVWGFFLSDAATTRAAQALVDASDEAMVLVVGWLAWTFVRELFDAYRARPAAAPAGGGGDGQDSAPLSRLATVLPLLRGIALTTVATVTFLVLLSRIGIDIGPLLAGAGVVGLAISFGSQALVRDIVSGIFFMTDDAFRVGEYIDTGRLKGVVEKLSLRSMQLRHQSGQLHTIPYGQIASVTNASRDWATVKFNIPLAHGADVDLARRLIKKVGQAMHADPELGRDFLQPLKLMGMADVTDGGVVIRLKFTARPAAAGALQREALKRVYQALVEAGIAFPSNALVALAGGNPPRPAAPAG